MDKQFASLASQLAVSLIWDLGLQMPPPEQPPRIPPYIHAPTITRQSNRKKRTLEEQRAVLGAFVITSMSVLYFSLPGPVLKLCLLVSRR
jgi:hypothetical protein